MAPADPPFNTIKYLPTTEAYNRWATVYDTDGNFLQALDDLEMRELLPRFEASIRTTKPWKLVDLGCGTGRNTALLLGIDNAQIVALDASEGMLAVAEKKLGALRLASEDKEGSVSEMTSRVDLQFGILDLLAPPDAGLIPRNADGIISTLVLEHVPLEPFFKHAAGMLKPGGVLLLTNMHSHMGGISQAGFVDTDTGEKIRPVSYAHTVQDVIQEAEKWGLVVESERGLREKEVTEDLVDRLGPRSRKWVGVTCWFGGLLRKMN